jgi:hypothetical protein
MAIPLQCFIRRFLERIFLFRCPLGNNPQLNPQMHCTYSLNVTRSLQSYNLGEDPQRTPLATLLLYRDVTVTCLPYRSIATAIQVTYRDNSSLFACGNYLATAVSLAPQFML